MAVRRRRGGVHPPSKRKYYNGCTEEEGWGTPPSSKRKYYNGCTEEEGGGTPPPSHRKYYNGCTEEEGGVHPPPPDQMKGIVSTQCNCLHIAAHSYRDVHVWSALLTCVRPPPDQSDHRGKQRKSPMDKYFRGNSWYTCF